MPDDVTRRLFEWGEETRQEGDADVIAVDFRHGRNVRAALIAVKRAFSLGALVPQLIANAFNVRRAADIESAVAMSGVPHAFVRRSLIVQSADRAHTPRVAGECAVVAMVVPDDGRKDDFVTPASNHEIARALSRIARRTVVYVDVPANIARQSMKQLGIPAPLIEGLLQHAASI